MGSDLPPNNGGSDEDLDEGAEVAEQEIARCLLEVLYDGSPLVRAELAICTNLFFWIRSDAAWFCFNLGVAGFVKVYISGVLIWRTGKAPIYSTWVMCGPALLCFCTLPISDDCPISLSAAIARLASSHNGMFRLAAAAYLKPPSHSTVLQASAGGQKSPGGYLSPTVVFAASHSTADHGSQTIDGGTPNQPVFRGVSSSGSLEGSAGLCHTILPGFLCLGL